MKKKILILNESYMPINITTHKKVIKMIAQEKLDVIEVYNNEYYHNGFPKNPSVVRLRHTIKMGKTRKIYKEFNRRNVLERDNYRCQYCSKLIDHKTMHWDHVIPREQGGPTNYTNIVACCLKCNQKKENKSLDKSGMKLKCTPEAPYESSSVYAIIINRINHLIGPSKEITWENYIYWNK
jgi:5-methylcytosine-specific restriction endonuclease McrA